MVRGHAEIQSLVRRFGPRQPVRSSQVDLNRYFLADAKKGDGKKPCVPSRQHIFEPMTNGIYKNKGQVGREIV